MSVDFDVELLFVEYLESIGPERTLLPPNDHFYGLDDKKFILRYRFSKEVVLKILEEIDHRLEYPTDKNKPLSPIQQLLLTLRYYATGSFQLVTADLNNVSKSTVCRYIKKVSETIASMRQKYIQFPHGQEMNHVMRNFYDIAEFPGVLGSIDCTHIPILSPGGQNAEVFRNRKTYFSINVQTISDTDLLIRNIVARWPGSVHDSYIFDNSEIRMLFENKRICGGHLLGDNGYRLSDYLLTPFLHCSHPSQDKYNDAHIKTRNTVERQYGVWKRRFPVLSLGISTNIETTLAIIVATGVLHNIAIQTKDVEPPEDAALHDFLEEIRKNDLENVPVMPVPTPTSGSPIDTRNRIVTDHFM